MLSKDAMKVYGLTLFFCYFICLFSFGETLVGIKQWSAQGDDISIEL